MDLQDSGNNNSVQQPNQNPPQTRTQIFLRMLWWFVPPAIISAFFIGLGLGSICILFCSLSAIENILVIIGLIALGFIIIYVPVISWYKLAQPVSLKDRFIQTFGLSFVGYIIVFGIIIAWVFAGGYDSTGYGPTVHEKMVQWIEKSVGNIQHLKWERDVESKVKNNSFNFQVHESSMALNDNNTGTLTVKGKFSGISLIGQELSNFDNNLVISNVSTDGETVEGSIAKQLKGSHFGLDTYVIFNGQLGGGQEDTQELTLISEVPKSFVDFVKSNSNKNLKVKFELVTSSPYSYKEFFYKPIWDTQQEILPKYLGRYYTDKNYHISYTLPEDSIRFNSIDSQGNFVTQPYDYSNFNLTTNQKQALCCEAPLLKAYLVTENIALSDYVNNLSWKEEIIESKKYDVPNGQAIVITARPTISSPYRVVIFGSDTHPQYGVRVYELTMKDVDLERVFNQYVSAIGVK